MPPGIVVDATAGGGGHTEILLELGHEVIAVDRDPAAVARLIWKFAGRPVRVIHSAFGSFPLETRVDGILADLGFSSDQLADSDRGFSFTSPGPPDMRMDPTEGLSAAELIETSSPAVLADIIFKYGEERQSRAIGRAIAGKRFASAKELADAISAAKHVKRGPIHPATKTFQALRIAVNDELGELARLLARAPEALKEGGRIGLISFHSLEDRIIKETFLDWTGRCKCPPRIPVCGCGAKRIAIPLWKGALNADELERNDNPRSRSAKMRAMIMASTE